MNKKISVMVSGLPGKMATMVAEAVKEQNDMKLLGHALAEADGKSRISRQSVTLVPLADHKQTIRGLAPDIIVDFTAPNAVNRNAELYCECGVPFIMGTTGGDREKLMETVKRFSIPAVISTNMAVPIVVLMEMMRFAAQKFPNSLEGYLLSVRESHQQTKKDKSGTAKTMILYFNALGIPFTEDQIFSERDPKAQKKDWHVPVQHLSGHGYHAYELLSPDGSTLIQIVHNVDGRNIYLSGVIRSVRFLARQERDIGKVFSMADVLRG
jgi:4-hydroxy-tetrahydrodipicolinate reductase